MQAGCKAAGQARQADEAGWGPGSRLQRCILARAQPAGSGRRPWQPCHQHACAVLKAEPQTCLVAGGQQDGLGARQEVRAVRAAVCGSGLRGRGRVSVTLTDATRQWTRH